MKTERHKVHLVALTPERALICKNATDAELGENKGIWIPAKRVVYFEGKWTHVNLTKTEARLLGL